MSAKNNDVVQESMKEVRRILAEVMQWNIRGFTEMPIKRLESERSIFGPIPLSEALVKETLMGHGFKLYYKNFRGKRTWFVSWKSEDVQNKTRTFFEWGTPILP